MTKLDFQALARLIQYRGWTFFIGEDGHRLFLQVQFSGKCSTTGKDELQAGRKWNLSPYMTRSEFVQTCLKAVLAAEEHEARERFLYQGRAVFGPHIDVDVLHTVLGMGESALDVRPPPPPARILGGPNMFATGMHG